jgi:hypothetical protein
LISNFFDMHLFGETDYILIWKLSQHESLVSKAVTTLVTCGVPVAYSCHYTMVLGELVTVGKLCRRPHQPILFENNLKSKKKLFLKKTCFLSGETDIKLTSKILHFSYQNVEKYQKKIVLIGVWCFGIFVWSGNMEVFDRSLTHIPIEMHTKYLSNYHIKYISNSDQFVSSGQWFDYILKGRTLLFQA